MVFGENSECGSVSCLYFVDGQFSLKDMELPQSATNFISFGFDTLNASLLSLQSVVSPNYYVDPYLQITNVDNIDPSKTDMVVFSPCDEYEPNNALDFGDVYYVDGTLFNFSEDASNLLNEFACNTADCEVLCTGTSACLGAKMQCGSGICNFRCNGRVACNNAEIQASGAESVSIICDADAACSDALIVVENVRVFSLECCSSSACQGIYVNLTGVVESDIFCYELSGFTTGQ